MTNMIITKREFPCIWYCIVIIILTCSVVLLFLLKLRCSIHSIRSSSSCSRRREHCGCEEHRPKYQPFAVSGIHIHTKGLGDPLLHRIIIIIVVVYDFVIVALYDSLLFVLVDALLYRALCYSFIGPVSFPPPSVHETWNKPGNLKTERKNHINIIMENQIGRSIQQREPRLWCGRKSLRGDSAAGNFRNYGKMIIILGHLTRSFPRYCTSSLY